MAKKKTAKKEVTVTAEVDLVEESDATRYTPWVPDNMPVGGKSNSTEQLNDHPTEHNHSAEAISDIVDRFADLRLYVPAANSCGVDGDLVVNGNIRLPIGGSDAVLTKSTPSDRHVFVINSSTEGSSPRLIMYGATDNSLLAGSISLETNTTTKLFVNDSSVIVNPHLVVDGKIDAGNPQKIIGTNSTLRVGEATSSSRCISTSSDSTSTRFPVDFWNPNGEMGRIATIAAGVRYETSVSRSTEELATTTDIPDALGTVEALQFRRFTDDDGVDGATAHDVYPFAVSAGMDPANPDYGVDYGRFTPLLGAALLELSAEVKDLRHRIAELEASTTNV